MRKNIFFYLLIVVITLFISASLTSDDEKFYYAFDEKIPLKAKTNTILVKYVEGVKKVKAIKFIEELSEDFKIKWHNQLTAEISTKSKKSTVDLLAKLKLNNDVYTILPFYTLEDGLDMGVTDEILIRFLPGVTVDQQKELQNIFDTRIVKTTKIYQKLIVPKGKDALEIANKYYETGLMEFAYPNFISTLETYQVIPNDTYFINQIACHNIGQEFTDGHSGTNDADIDAPEAWEITSGISDIVIAVLDQGVTSDHPDLPNSRQERLNGSNFGDGDANDPSPTGNNNHGNSTAGIIAATMNNNQGIAGIAPNCVIMPVRIFNSDGSGLKQLTDTRGYTCDWSPDGKQIVYTDSRAENGRLWIMDVDGSNKKQLTFEYYFNF